jgi:AcrR family transcriptional regulator
MSDQKRPYRMTRRAELEELTRRRITQSAMTLHEELGPARTSISAIAAHAGVRRSTVYRHFPDEAALFSACSTHWRAANPVPGLQAWAAIEDPPRRTETALRELYAFYGRTQAMYASLLRDEPLVPIVQHLLRDFHGYLRAVEDVLMAGRGLSGKAARRTRAAIGHAVAFSTWRSLTQTQRLPERDAAALMGSLIEGAQDSAR